ncbi:unnamed protein product [Mycena citricolor]|uniref:Uncharacterized protein n=1 Tax=Mycena citricolor TaxID=2018698 RepID=A0AAD2GWU7_9AGAR|nr:unnamed protein product [Mycena citricolor]
MRCVNLHVLPVLPDRRGSTFLSATAELWRKMRWVSSARVFACGTEVIPATMSAFLPVRYLPASPSYLPDVVWLVAIFGTYVYNVEIEHKAHNAHLMAENDGKLPQPPRFEYLNKRNKPFPWGMNSLFFNSSMQRDMTIED